MTAFPAPLATAGIGLTVGSAAHVLERAGYEHAVGIALVAALAAAGLVAMLRVAPRWLQPD